ncbi:DUF4153 domain-containing protein [Dyadobacter sp. LHD-138]|uniref:DUF4153 domain-containing protein n=1 Tax=Dyadobacter sp. LHD-138 TaxID=3071413 RepID=UPI0027DED131|nr:DUF4153 domain-containing protein [Dyadobacter sp. LHD-138]MDQ6481734.1 DUF4153 domain-containing protein [Dyadobacter sp. LHD-138]
MIKLPSLQALTESFLHTVVRYKWVVLTALIKLILLIYYIETPYQNETIRNLLTRLSYTFFLSLPMVLAIQLVWERRQWKNNIKIGLLGGTAALLVCYYFSINKNPSQTDYYRFLLFMAAAHLLVSFAPFLKYDEPNGFWQFNKTLFLQFLNAALYSTTLYLGLLIAIETVTFLFDIKFLFEIEADLFFAIFIFFHTVFFLSKIPENLENLEQQTDYPSGLKIFTQYVLLPLEVIYLLILYAYTGKILFQWQLPEGGVAYLVLAFSIAGILALLLLHPLRKSSKESWISLFSHRFYLALLPLIILLFTGIFRRINDYGVTENRYLVAVLAFWLAGITIYFLTIKRSDIRWIPLTLSIISFIMVVGPWNIFKVAESSQLNQFHEILVKNKLVNKENKIVGKAVLPDEEYNQLFSIIQFFREREKSSLDKYFQQLPPNTDRNKFYNAIDDFMRKHVSNKTSNEFGSFRNYSSDIANQQEINLNGYDFLLDFNVDNSLVTRNKEWKISSENNGKIVSIYRHNQKIVSFDIEKKMDEISQQFGSNSNKIPQQMLSLKYDDSKNHLKIILRTISGDRQRYYVHGYLLYNN